MRSRWNGKVPFLRRDFGSAPSALICAHPDCLGYAIVFPSEGEARAHADQHRKRTEEGNYRRRRRAVGQPV